jgi:hypothetical protein
MIGRLTGLEASLDSKEIVMGENITVTMRGKSLNVTMRGKSLNVERVKGYSLLLCFSNGLSPKTLVALGFPRSTVYRWYRNYRIQIKVLKKDLENKILCLSQRKKISQIP